MVKVKNEYEPDYVTPPGYTLREILDIRGMSQTDLAERIGQSRNHIAKILRGDAPITTETAIKLDRTLGVPARFWGNRELHYREYLALKAEKEKLAKRSDWLKRFPVANMVKLGWIERVNDNGEQLQVLLDYFQVATPEVWEEYWGKPQVAYRKSKSLKTDPYALAAWLRQGEISAASTSCRDYDATRFKFALQNIRKLTLEPPKIFQPELTRLCAACGVAVAFITELPKTASGATRWLPTNKALIQLSLRYKTNDHFWFTFYHEAAHILLHGKRQVFVEGKSYDSVEESIADEFASNMLLPKKAYSNFIQSETFSKAAIRRFADETGIASGIVVGRLQHDGFLPYSHCNDLKRKFKWN